MTESPSAPAVPSPERFFAPLHARTLLQLLALAAAGYAYVTSVMCGRSPFASAPGASWEFLKLIAGLILLWPLLNGWITRRWTWSAPDARWGLILFVLTLHWQWIPRYVGIDFALDASLLGGGLSMPVAIVLMAAAAGLGFAISRHIIEAHHRRQLLAYLALLIAIIATPALITFALRNSHALHLHHYALGAMLMPMTRYPSRLSGALFGFAFGLLIEGSARWGLDPCWIPR